ncbi:hypothetical protein SSPO_086880 [Streptomyces antimycoticus]|uniref:Uncharacterized protein n=1 Tax=Streptomyces antimycoticus TaxID=68175 RepID=A0A499UZ55_9ACTN|nr:hypothetical protein [Streptomyces antimycoticus]BBJ45970.1 hypothetical protein SSPO_086880 [Streptomyces antimycoticus]
MRHHTDSDCGGRVAAEVERLPCGSDLGLHGKWLVGLQFHTADFQRFWLYYVVDGACDASHAVCRALRCADRDPDRVARSGVQAEADQIQVQQILRDALGSFRLTRSF